MIKKVIFISLLVYTFFGFFALPYIIKSQLQSIVNKNLNAALSIQKVTFNPYTFIITIDQAVLNSIDNKKVASVESVQINLEPHSLFYKALYIKDIALQKPYFYIAHQSDKTFNILNLQKEQKNASDGSREGLRVILDSLRVYEGKIVYQDYTKKSLFQIDADNIDIKVEGVDTKEHSQKDAKLRFTTTLSDGALIDVRSYIKGFNPFIAEGNLSVESAKLYSAFKFVQDDFFVEVADGSLDMKSRYHIDLSDLNSTLIDDIYLSLDNFRLKPKGNFSDILALKSLKIDNVSIKPMQQAISIDNILFSNLDINAKRDAKSNIDWLLYTKSTKNETNAATDTTKPWEVVLKNIELKKFSAKFLDEAIFPNVTTRVNELNLNIRDIELLSQKPFLYKLDFILNDKSKCNSSGSVKQKEFSLDSKLKCSEFDIKTYLPYIDKVARENLNVYNVELKSATIGFDTMARIESKNELLDVKLKDSNLSIKNFVLNQRDNNQKVSSFKDFELSGLDFDSVNKNISIKKALLNGFEIGVERLQEGKLNLVSLVEPKHSKISQDKHEPYRVVLDEADIVSAKAIFNDRNFDGGMNVVAENIKLNARGIDSRAGSKFNYDLSLNINDCGSIKSKADIKHTPFEYRGNINVAKISLKDINPYIQDGTFLNLSDGFANVNAKIEYRQNDNYIKAEGDLSIDEFYVEDSRSAKTIASLARADVKAFEYINQSNLLMIDEITLNSFYVDVMIDEKKNFNLSKLLKEQNTTLSKAKKDENITFLYNISKINILSGSADFADYSIPIHFKTLMHSLDGSINALSNKKGDISHIEINGIVDEYGEARIKGSLKPSNIKSFMDIGLSFKNLELSAMSGYVAQFAGYKIDDGKLYLDLKYKLQESNLQSQNSVIIKNIVLGDEIEDENITKLPLSLAVLLLEDSNRVIDLSIPIDGNIDSPDFKYGSLVFKALANLVLKAVASPFKFLAKAVGIGGGEELENIEFEAAKNTILPYEREKLDKLSNALEKKEQLKLVIHGSYDREVDSAAIRAKKLEQKLSAQVKNSSSITSGLEGLYKEKLPLDDLLKLQKELMSRVSYEMYDIEYQKELFKICASFEEVLDTELENLAKERAKQIQDYFIRIKQVELKRVEISEITEVFDSVNGFIKTKFRLDIQ